MASFRGTTLPLAITEAGELPRRRKVIEFPGSDGIEVLDMGLGARHIIVHCVSSGSPSRSTLEGLMDGDTGTLSADGESYGDCELVGVSLDRNINTSGGRRRYFTLRFHQRKPD